MTIQGAIAELKNLLEVDDVPFYYKVAIKKVIETIQMEMADRKTEPQKTTDYCKKCDHKGCETCAADGSNPHCVPSRYEPQIVGKHADVIIIDEPQTCNDCDLERCETCVTEIGKDEPQTKEYEEPNYYDPALWE